MRSNISKRLLSLPDSWLRLTTSVSGGLCSGVVKISEAVKMT